MRYICESAAGDRGATANRFRGDCEPSSVAQFERIVTPATPGSGRVDSYRNVDDTLTDDAGLITGVIDFGDMNLVALTTDVAWVLDSLRTGRDGAELVRLARLVLDGYQRRTELGDLELSVLGLLWAARSAVTIPITSWRAAEASRSGHTLGATTPSVRDDRTTSSGLEAGRRGGGRDALADGS